MKTFTSLKFYVLLSMLMFRFLFNAGGQTTIFNENFEGTLQVTPSGVPLWAVNTTLQVSGSNSYQNVVAFNDSSMFVTSVIDLTGYNYVLLDFYHICKIEFFDAAEIYISVNGGTSWTKLTQSEYLGTAQFGTNGDKFTATSYPLLWLPSQHSQPPTNLWWMQEQFNISALAGNESQVMLKFKLRDGNANGANTNAGWFLDDIRIIASPYELIPPEITLNPPILQDTVFSAGPFPVSATITDASGIHQADLIFRIDSTVWDTIPMMNISGNIYEAEIPGQPYNTVFDYFVRAIDASLSYNEAETPVITFVNKKPPPVVIVGTGTGTQNYAPAYGWYDYSWSGILYSAPEINASGPIDSIGFFVNNSIAPFIMNNQAMYLRHTTSTFYDGSNNQMPVPAQFTQIYTGNVSWTGPGWYMFKVQTPFVYNGSQALEVAWINNDGSYTSGYPTFAGTTTAQNTVKYLYADVSMPTGAGTLSNIRPNLKLVFMPNDNDYDAGVVAINEPTGVVLTSTPVDVKVQVKNFGIITLTDFDIEWEINGVPQTTYSWTGTLLEDVTSGQITLGTANFNTGNNYIRAWTSDPNGFPDENNLNDTLSSMVFGCDNILSGTFSVNSALPSGAGNFNTLGEAITAMNTCGISGPVVFELYDAVYNQEMILGEIPGSSTVNTVTFRPAAGNTVTITSSGTATLRLNGTKNVIFDGSNNGTGTRDMTIENSSTSVNTAAVWLSSQGGMGQGCENIILQNCIIKAGSNTATSTFGVYVGGMSISTFGTGDHNNNISLINNHISKAYYGIYARAATPNLNLLIESNDIGSNNPADFVLYRGVDLQGATDPVISSNHIYNMKNTTGTNIAAIEIGQNVSGAHIVKNNIHGIYQESTGGWGAYGISIISGTGVSNILIANNFISDLMAINYSSVSTAYNPFGIRITGGSNIKIYHNSINLFGQPTVGTSASMSACLLITTAVSGLDVRNNIFANRMTGNAGTKSYTVYKATSTAFTTINYNDYYPSGSFGFVGYSGSADVTDLTAWQAVTGQDANSISEDPVFISDINLHTFSTTVNDKGTPLADVTDDIDGDARDPLTPDIGADEFSPLSWDLQVLSIETPASICGLTNSEPVVATVKNNGANTITSFDATYILNSGTPVTQTFNVNIATDSVSTITFTQTADLSALQTYTLNVEVDLTGDGYADNDTLSKIFAHGHNFSMGHYSMGFESSEPYQLWSVINNNSDAGLWQFPHNGAAFAHTGTFSARFFNNAVNAGDDYLFSRCFTMYAGEVYGISYWQRVENASYPHDIALKVASPDPTVAATTTTLLAQTGINNTTYQELSSVFTVPADGVYYFVWHATSPASNFHAFIDDINIQLLPPQDASVVAIEGPVGGCGLGVESISIDIANSGSQTISGNLTANYQVNGGPVVTENVTATINVGDTLNYTFTTPIDFTVTTFDVQFDIVAWVDLLNDPVSFNDSIGLTVMSMHTPADPVVVDDTIFYAGQATLQASSTATIYWFTNPAGGSYFHTGNTYTTPPLFVNTTYWVESSNSVLEIDSLPTTFAGGNGCGAGNMFDVIALNDDIIITGFHLNPSVTQSGLPVIIYYKSGTHTGFETNQAAWTLLGNYTVNAVSATPTYLDCADFTIPGGQTYGIYVQYNANYTNGTNTYSNSDISIVAGMGHCSPFDGCCFPRTFNGIVHYKKEVPGCSSNRVPVTAYVDLYQWEAGVINLDMTPSGCASDVEPLTIEIVNYGNSDITGNLTAHYTVNGGTPVSEPVTATILSGDTLLFTFTTPVSTGLTPSNPDVNLNIVAWIELTGDVFNINDTVSSLLNYNYTPDPPVVSNLTIPYGTTATINATSPVDLVWYDSPTGSPIFTGNPYVSPVLYSSTSYWVAAGLTLNMQFTFDTDLQGWTASAPCIAPYTFVWDSDGGNGTAFMVNPGTSSGAALYSPVFNVNADTTFLSFRHKYNTESCCDEAYVAYRLDGGQWITFVPVTGSYTTQTAFISPSVLANCASTSSQPAWSGNSNGYIISSGNIVTSGASTIEIAFSFNSDGSVAGVGWYIDEVNIEASGCASDLVQVDVTVGSVPAVDVGPVAITAPNNGINLGSQSIIAKVKNYGTDPVTNIPISYSINGGIPVNETITTTIQPGDTLTHQFTTQYNFAAYGSYNITVYTALSTDAVLVNDTITKTIQNNPLVYCVSAATSSFDGDIGNVTISNLNNGNPLPVMSNSTATNTYSDFTLSLPPVELAGGQSYPISVSGIWSGSWIYDSYVKVFIDFNIDGVFDPVNELVFEGQMNQTITTLSGTANVPFTASTGYTRMRVVMMETTMASAVQPCGTYSYGETEDYTVLIAPLLPYDGGVISIVSPDGIFSEGDQIDVIVEVFNFGTDTLTTIPLSYQHNVNPPVLQTWTGNLAPAASVQVIMPPVTVASGVNSICAKTEISGDSNTFNDETCDSFWGLPGLVIFEDDFEGSSTFTTTGTVWQHGEPAGLVINNAFSGDSCWVTVLNGQYPPMATEYLVSQAFNFTGIYDAYLSLAYWMDGETNFDGGNIQYSTNNGGTWTTLGVIDDPEGYNWYDSYVGAQASWSEPTGGWKSAFISLEALDNAGSAVKLRFVFRSNASIENEGYAVDNVKIHVPAIPADAGVIEIVSPSGQSITGGANNVTVKLKNFGTTTLTSIPVSYKLNPGPAAVNATWTGSLDPGEETNFTFVQTYTGPFNPYTLCSYTTLTGDAYKFNDSTCVYLTPGQASIDGGVIDIVSPTEMPGAGQSVQVIVTIENFGADPLTNFPVQYSVDGAVQTTEIVQSTLNPGATMNYTYVTQYTSQGAEIELCAKTAIPSDAIPSNDFFCKDILVGIGEVELDGVMLYQNIPNPATDETEIAFSIPVPGKVTFTMVNILGQAMLSETSDYASGMNVIRLNLQDIAPGIYYYSIQFEQTKLTKKMTIH
jgi:hypothetical protein